MCKKSNCFCGLFCCLFKNTSNNKAFSINNETTSLLDDESTKELQKELQKLFEITFSFALKKKIPYSNKNNIFIQFPKNKQEDIDSYLGLRFLKLSNPDNLSFSNMYGYSFTISEAQKIRGIMQKNNHIKTRISNN